jgi:hypothetical protein
MDAFSLEAMGDSKLCIHARKLAAGIGLAIK